MATILRIKRSETAGNPTTLAAGELAYSGLTFNGSNGGDRLYIGMGTETNGNAVNHVIIGGKYFTDLLDHNRGTVVADSALIVDSNKKLNELLVDNITIDGNSISTTDENGNLILEPNGSGKVYLTTDTVRIGDAAAAATLTTNGTGNLTISTNGGTNSGTIGIVAGTAGDITVTPNGTGKSIITNIYTDANTSLAEYIYDTVGGAITAGTGITVTNSDPENTSIISITATGVTAGSYGSGSQIPTFTVNAQGQLTAAGTANIATTLNISGGTGTDGISLLTDTLTFTGGTGVTTAVTNNTLTISIGQSVGTTDNVTFNNVTVNGTLSSDDITAANISVAGNATITGNLTVQGTTTTVNSTAVAITDINIELAKDATTAAQANGAGLTVAGASATFTYTSANDRWNLNKDLVVANTYGDLKGNADTATKWQTARNLSLTGDATATLSSVDGSAAVSAALTLATVNSNVGSFGSSTVVPTITVNAKGLVTAVTTNNIPTATTSVLGLASFDAAQFTVTGGAVTINVIEGGNY